MTQAAEQLGIEIESVILAGDSAGGHLTMSVTNMCLVRGFRPPDGLLVLYPVLTLNMQMFFPSTLMTADDEILSAGFISFCQACINRKGGNPEANPIMSPVVAPPAMLKMLPPTQFVVCEVDGLRDQTYEMAYRML